MTTKKGRPTVFTPEILEEILFRLADGESARAIFKSDHMPNWQAFCAFKRKPENKAFNDQYMCARDDCMAAWEQKIIEVAEDDSNDFQPDGKGGIKSDNTAVNRARLKIDSMKWIMSKLSPKTYGDKVQTEISGPAGGPIPVVNIGAKSSTE